MTPVTQKDLNSDLINQTLFEALIIKKVIMIIMIDSFQLTLAVYLSWSVRILVADIIKYIK